MRYVEARLQMEQRDTAYRIYVTDTLKAITHNTTDGDSRVDITVRYAEMFSKKKKETRTPKEVIESIKQKLEG